MDDALKQFNNQTGNPTEGTPYFTEPPKLTEKEIRERSFDLYRLFTISQVRESSLPQFDGMGYTRYNETNEMADISYLAPKKNKGDSRITTGVTHEKDSSLVSFFLNLNFEGNVKVFYKDKEITEAGTALTKLVRKTREEESYDNKRSALYRNFVAQGTAFALEEYIEEWIPDKKITGKINPARLDEVKWVENGMRLLRKGCQTSMVDGKKVFLEDIRQPDIQKQPGVYIVEYVPREILKSIWGKTPRWKNVPYMVNPTATSLGTLTQGSIYSDWIFGEIDFNKCEVIKVFRPFEQRFQIYINGVPMLPAGFPIKAVSPSGGVPIAKGDIDLMNMFAYSKSEPAKTKIDQAVFDEILQNMIVKFRQSAFVPRANNTDRILSPDMFLGGRLISNIDKSEIEPLIDNPGITPADFSFYQLLKEQIDSKTISSLLEGNPAGGEMTLGQYMDMQKKQMLKIGGKIDGLIQWERQMLKLRVANIVAGVYRSGELVTLKDTMANGLDGVSIMKFTDENYFTSDDVFEQEINYKNQTGQEAEITYLSPMKMKEILEDPDYCIYYEVIPVDKNNDKLTQMMFVSMIQQAAQLFGMESLQVANLKKQYAALMGKSFDDIFISEQEMQAKQQQLMQQEMEKAQMGIRPNGSEAAMKAPINPMQASMTDLMFK